jgi:ATP-dependent Lhr-like helicase
MGMDSLSSFCDPVQRWFREAFDAPTPVQSRGWPALCQGHHVLMLAPTGSGKTLAAFLAALDQLVRPDGPEANGYSLVYVSPLKALVADIERNLRAPLAGIANAGSRAGITTRAVRVDVRTGDTPARDRAMMAKRPGDVLVTTPESLYLMLGSEAREGLRAVRTVIIDEIHALASTKRGVHLALSLERLAASATADPQRVGLSATQRPLEEVARYLGGDRPVTIIDASGPPRLDLRVVVPTADMERPVVAVEAPRSGGDGQRQKVGGVKALAQAASGGRASEGMWPVITPELLALIRGHRSTLIFTNSRLACERLAQRINELAGEELVRAHHGSVSHEQRAAIEDALKRGLLPGIVATSSLELGIDMGAIDLVVLVESPGSVAAGLQRVGRAGHSVGLRSEGWIFPKYRADLLEAVVVSQRMAQAEVEVTQVPSNCLDVLAQQIVAAVATDDLTVDALSRMVRRAASYRDLSDAAFHGVLDMLSGKYPSDAFAELSPRLNWDRATDTLVARKGAKLIAALNGGTIADRGSYAVHRVGDGGRLGELDEEMVYETRKGDRIILGASTWKVEEVARDRVVVSPAPGEPGRLPFWRGQKPGRPAELGRAIGAMVGAIAAGGHPEPPWLNDHARTNLRQYVAEQLEATGAVPTDERIVVERFRDELGDWRVCVLCPWGAKVTAPWGMALEAHFAQTAGYDVQALWTDDGVCLRFIDADELPPLDALFPDPDEVEEVVTRQLAQTAMFSAHFRENAARALLLPRRRGQGRTPLWQQRLRAQNLQQIATGYPAFPIVLETYRECLREVFDLEGLVALLRGVRERRISVHEVETRRPSPFSRNLVFAYVAAFMYAGDAPVAERRAQALALDRDLLRDLLGQDELHDLLDPAVAQELEEELQRTEPSRRARHPDALHDLLRRVGDRSLEELGRATVDGLLPEALRELATARRVAGVRLAGVERWIAVEDAAAYRDALGVVLPPGLPEAFLAPAPDPLRGLLLRWARTHAPFTAAPLAARWGLSVAALEAVLDGLEARGQIVRGLGRGEWADAEVLRRLRQRNLARLRDQVAPVEPAVYARFLLGWQGVGGARALVDVARQLQGVPLPASQLDEVFARRVRGYRPGDLDQLGAMGELVWVGRGSVGPRDGRVALYRREQVASLLEPPVPPDDLFEGPSGPLRLRLLEHLRGRGASFVVALQAVGAAPLDAVVEALWDLAWAGLVTNDTFAPLRALAAKRGRAATQGFGGRWSAVDELLSPAPSTTARAVAQASQLLERHGVASAAAARADGLTWSALYPVLRQMEESGKVRRGWFVDGLEGAQFAMGGVIDRLRASREADEPAAVVPVTDPANPWGATLPWPPTQGRARRVLGSALVMVQGAPVWLVERSGRSAVVLGEPEADAALAALRAWVASVDRPSKLSLEQIDGAPALDHAWAPWLQEVGFVRSYKGWAWGS